MKYNILLTVVIAIPISAYTQSQIAPCCDLDGNGSNESPYQVDCDGDGFNESCFESDCGEPCKFGNGPDPDDGTHICCDDANMNTSTHTCCDDLVPVYTQNLIECCGDGTFLRTGDDNAYCCNSDTGTKENLRTRSCLCFDCIMQNCNDPDWVKNYLENCAQTNPLQVCQDLWDQTVQSWGTWEWCSEQVCPDYECP